MIFMKQGNNQVIAIVQKIPKKTPLHLCHFKLYTLYTLDTSAITFIIKCINRFNTWYNWDPWNSIQPCTQPYFGNGRKNCGWQIVLPFLTEWWITCLRTPSSWCCISTQLSTGYFLHVASESWTQFIYKVTQNWNIFITIDHTFIIQN